MRTLNDVPTSPKSPLHVIAASVRGFGPKRLRRRPAIFAIVLAGLLTGLLGAGDLMSKGPAPFALLEMSFTIWGLAFIANLIDVLCDGAGGDDATGCHLTGSREL